MSNLVINNLSVSGAGAANDIGAASGADTPAKVKTIIGTTDAELLQLENITASGLDGLGDGTVYKRLSVPEKTQVDNIVASGLDAIADGTAYKRVTAAGKTAADAIGAASGATTALKLANLTSPASTTQRGVALLGADTGAVKIEETPQAGTFIRWSFDTSVGDWVGFSNATISATDGKLRWTVGTTALSVIRILGSWSADTYKYIRLKIRRVSGTGSGFYIYTNSTAGSKSSATQQLGNDTVDMVFLNLGGPTGTITNISICLEAAGTSAGDVFELDDITLYGDIAYSAGSTNLAGVSVNRDMSVWGGTTGQKITSIAKYAKNTITFKKSGAYMWIRTAWDTVSDLVQSFESLNGVNASLNMRYQRFVPIATENVSIDELLGTLAKTAVDDIAPVYYNNTYIGANHGANIVQVLTVTAHGKTNVDVGSEWVDAGATAHWWIIKVPDANTLWVVSENTPSGDVWSYNTTIVGPLSHVSGATHTDQIAVGTKALGQLTPITRNVTNKYYCDGVEVVSDGYYSGDIVDVVHTYEILHVPSLMDYLIANVGTGTAPDYSNAAVSAAAYVRIIYRYQPNGACVVFYQITPKKTIKIGYIGGTQAMAPAIPSGGSLWAYIPDMVAFTVGSNNYDFSAIQNITSLAEDLHFTATRWSSAAKPPSRMVHLTKTSAGAKYYGFIEGYAPIGWGLDAERKDKIYEAGFISSAKKLYPKYITSSSTDYPDGVIAANTPIELVAYRCPINYTTYPDETCAAFYNVGKTTYCVLDYHASIAKKVPVPANLYGKTITVVEKTDSFTLLDSIVMPDGIAISVDTYGYAVLKIE